jgi:hypothetical protein
VKVVPERLRKLTARDGEPQRRQVGARQEGIEIRRRENQPPTTQLHPTIVGSGPAVSLGHGGSVHHPLDVYAVSHPFSACHAALVVPRPAPASVERCGVRDGDTIMLTSRAHVRLLQLDTNTTSGVTGRERGVREGERVSARGAGYGLVERNPGASGRFIPSPGFGSTRRRIGVDRRRTDVARWPPFRPGSCFQPARFAAASTTVPLSATTSPAMRHGRY